MLQLNQNYLQDNGPLFALRQMLSVGTLCFMLFSLLCLHWVQMDRADVLFFSELEIGGAFSSWARRAGWSLRAAWSGGACGPPAPVIKGLFPWGVGRCSGLLREQEGRGLIKTHLPFAESRGHH